jgi:hypothetical protein
VLASARETADPSFYAKATEVLRRADALDGRNPQTRPRSACSPWLGTTSAARSTGARVRARSRPTPPIPWA